MNNPQPTPCPWFIDHICHNGMSLPTHITIQLYDRKFLPVLKEFVAKESLVVDKTPTDHVNQYWIECSYEKQDQIKWRLEQRLLDYLEWQS